MGLYDVNLKKTNIGYQFDRNVYIGIQTNDNRVVTFKDLGNAIVASSGGGGGSAEDIQLTVDSITGDPTNPADHISFHRDGEEVAFDILPQFVRAANSEELSDEELADAKACLLLPVVDENDNVVGYKVYYAETTALPTLELIVGADTYTYDGSAAITVDLSATGAVKALKANTGYILGTATAVTATEAAAAVALDTVGTNQLKWAGSAVSAGQASSWINANITGQLAHTLNIAATGIEYTYDGTRDTTISFDSLPTVAASGIEIAYEIPDNDTSTDIPTAGAVHKFAAAAGSVKATASVSGYILGTPERVTATTITDGTPALHPIGADTENSLKWASTPAAAGQAVKWINANVTGQLNHTLSIAAAGITYTFNGDSDTTISFDSLPTVAAAAVDVVTTVTNSASTNIPTEGAVYQAIQELSPGISGTATQGGGNAVTGVAYNAATKILTAEKNTTFLTNIEAGSGISVSGSEAARTVSLDAIFGDPTLSWGSSASYAQVGSAIHYISLPSVDTLPTVAASAVDVVNTIATVPVGAIPTDIAVIEALERAPGIATVTSAGSGDMVTAIDYDRSTRTLSYTKMTAAIDNNTITIGTHSTTWTNTAGLSWDASNQAVKSSLDNSSAVIPTGSTTQPGLLALGTAATQAAAGNHAHATLSLFGQQDYTGATGRTLAAGNGILATTSNATTTLSLHATFNNVTLAWGSSVEYAEVGGQHKTLSLPNVDTLPTVAAAAIDMTNTVNSSSTASEIPTAQAVFLGIMQQYSALFSYDATSGILTINVNN